MLPEVGGLELLVIAAVALIVVGPKDLPMMLRKLGQFTARLRAMAADFRSSFDEMARQSELDDLRKEVEAMRQSASSAASHASNADVNQVFNEIGDSLEGSGVQFNPPMSHQYSSESEAAPIVEEAKPRARRSAKPKVEAAAAADLAPKKTAAAKPKAASKAPAKAKTVKAGAKA
jgi:sec-independent protein translocase protein TatB